MLSRTVIKYSGRPACRFKLMLVKKWIETLNWGQLSKVTQAANGFKSLGVEKDKVAYILPNCSEAVITFLAGSTAGIVVPMAHCEPDQMAGILNLAEVKVAVTLNRAKTDVAQKVALALEKAQLYTFSRG